MSGGMVRGPLFSIKNSSVDFNFSFLKAFPASSKEEQDINKKNIRTILNFILFYLFLNLISFNNINIMPNDIKISAILKLNQ